MHHRKPVDDDDDDDCCNQYALACLAMNMDRDPVADRFPRSSSEQNLLIVVVIVKLLPASIFQRVLRRGPGPPNDAAMMNLCTKGIGRISRRSKSLRPVLLLFHNLVDALCR
jgi:hypothetical protein